MGKIPNLSMTSKTKEESCCLSDMTSLYPHALTYAHVALVLIQTVCDSIIVFKCLVL